VLEAAKHVAKAASHRIVEKRQPRKAEPKHQRQHEQKSDITSEVKRDYFLPGRNVAKASGETVPIVDTISYVNAESAELFCGTLIWSVKLTAGDLSSLTDAVVEANSNHDRFGGSLRASVIPSNGDATKGQVTIAYFHDPDMVDDIEQTLTQKNLAASLASLGRPSWAVTMSLGKPKPLPAVHLRQGSGGALFTKPKDNTPRQFSSAGLLVAVVAGPQPSQLNPQPGTVIDPFMITLNGQLVYTQHNPSGVSISPGSSTSGLNGIIPVVADDGKSAAIQVPITTHVTGTPGDGDQVSNALGLVVASVDSVLSALDGTAIAIREDVLSSPLVQALSNGLDIVFGADGKVAATGTTLTGIENFFRVTTKSGTRYDIVADQQSTTTSGLNGSYAAKLVFNALEFFGVNTAEVVTSVTSILETVGTGLTAIIGEVTSADLVTALGVFLAAEHPYRARVWNSDHTAFRIITVPRHPRRPVFKPRTTGEIKEQAWLPAVRSSHSARVAFAALGTPAIPRPVTNQQANAQIEVVTEPPSPVVVAPAAAAAARPPPSTSSWLRVASLQLR
jgi:hypothetical protein